MYDDTFNLIITGLTKEYAKKIAKLYSDQTPFIYPAKINDVVINYKVEIEDIRQAMITDIIVDFMSRFDKTDYEKLIVSTVVS